MIWVNLTPTLNLSKFESKSILFALVLLNSSQSVVILVSSEGALIAITPYDYPQQHPLFEDTPVLDNNLHIMP